MSELKLNAVKFVQRNLKNLPKHVPCKSCIKHWGIILFIYDTVDECQLTPKIIDANKNSEGIIQCTVTTWEGAKKREWENMPGFELEEFPLEGKEHPFSDEWLHEFVRIFNEKQKTYDPIIHNCHAFVQSLLIDLDLDDILRKLPMSAKRTCKETIQWSNDTFSNSSLGLIKTAIPKILRKVTQAEIEIVAKKSVQIGGTWKTSSMVAVVDPAIREQAEQLLPKIGGEAIELLASNSEFISGTFTLWQLLQIPAEMIVTYAIRAVHPEKKDLAYGCSKLSSCITAATIGGVVGGGPLGALGGVAMWFAGELFSFLLRLICKGISKMATHDSRDVFDDIIGPSRTLRLLQYAKSFIIDKMISYIKSTQKKKLKSIEQLPPEIENDESIEEEGDEELLSSFVVVDRNTSISSSTWYL